MKMAEPSRDGSEVIDNEVVMCLCNMSCKKNTRILRETVLKSEYDCVVL